MSDNIRRYVGFTALGKGITKDMIRNRMKRLAVVLTAMLIPMSVVALSGETTVTKISGEVDTSKKGSITFSITDPANGNGFPGISMELIQVATLVPDGNGNNVFKYTSAFDNPRQTVVLTDISESDMGAREKAEALRNWANQNNIHGTAAVTDASGKVSYPNLALGVYLVRNYPVSENKESVRPFLVTVPRLLNNEFVYDVDANGKPEAPDIGGETTEKKTEKETKKKKETEPSKGGKTTTSGGGGNTSVTGGRLPQTGQLWWPVPVLGAGGIILILIGIMRRRKNAQANET